MCLYCKKDEDLDRDQIGKEDAVGNYVRVDWFLLVNKWADVIYPPQKKIQICMNNYVTIMVKQRKQTRAIAFEYKIKRDEQTFLLNSYSTNI